MVGSRLRVLVGCAALLASAVLGAGAGVPAELSAHYGNLDGQWRFRTDPREVGEAQGWHSLDADEAGWRTLIVPGRWEPQGVTDPRPGKPPKPKGRLPWTDYDGVAWYRLRFVVPAAWAGQPMVLRLGSVDDRDRTFLNGRLVGATGRGLEHPSHVHRVYHVPADVVRFGQANVLAVRVFDGGGPGGLVGPMVSLLPKKIAEASMRLPQSDRPLAERFADPPAATRILKIVHAQPASAEGRRSLRTMLMAQGFGGMVSNLSFRGGYVENEDNWSAFVDGMKGARDAGMCLWLYDERGYPSGTAGGITLRGHPEWQARGLLIADASTDGEPVALDLPPGRLVRASAFPVNDGGIDVPHAVDLTGAIHDGKLEWRPPAGSWRVMAITESYIHENTHAALNLHDTRPYINLLMPEPTQRFLEVTHDRYAARLGDDLGRWFVSTFTDEPSLMSRFMRPMPYRVLPWAPNLPGEFEKRRGYALGRVVPLLIADGPNAAKARYDFWLTIGELVSENFFGQIQDWCRRHKLASGGHLLLEERIVDHVAFYGDFFRCVRHTDAPSIDCLTSIPSHVPWRIARMIGSIADLNGNRVTMSETSDHVQRYRRPEDKRPVRIVTEDEIRGTCNRLILNGINTITSYYGFGGLSTVQLRGLNEWVGRCCTMLKGGCQVTDLAVVYPVESIWPRFEPARSGATDSASAMQVQRVFDRVSEILYTNRRDFTYIDCAALANARVEAGALVHGKLSWRVVILPCADTLPLDLWEKLARFWGQGGVIVSVAARPRNSETEFPSPRVTALAGQIFSSSERAEVRTNSAGGVGVYLPEGAEALLPVALDGLIEPDVGTAARRSPIRVAHRRVDGHEVYFLINDSGRPCRDTVSVAAEGQGELWDPATGRRALLTDGPNVDVDFAPYRGVFLRFPRARRPQRYAVQNGQLPGLDVASLPACEPTVGKGKFVDANVARQSHAEAGGRPAWRAVGTLSKGGVDTFLFLSFDYAEPLDLSDAHVLALDTWVPEGQRTPSRLLVIVREKGGGDFIARAGRALNVPGHAQTFLPLSELKLAGWSKDSDGELDCSRVAFVRIGWGGYYGQKGEVVEFSAARPQVGRIAKARPRAGP